MDTLLEQNTIDLLFAGRQDNGDVEAEAAPVAVYSFGRAGRMGSEQMRSIAAVNEQVARNLTRTLGAWLRTQITVAAAAGEQMSFGDFVRCLPETNFVSLLKLEPLGGLGLLEVGLPIAFAMVDLLLGGKGSGRAERKVTDIESAILHSMLQIVTQELNSAWKPFRLSFETEKQDTQMRIDRLLPASEQILCLSLDVQMPNVQGPINIGIPAGVLNALHRSMSATPTVTKRRDPAATAQMEAQMLEARLRVALEMTHLRVSSRALQTMEPGTVLELGLPRSSAAELTLNGARMC
ncbi:MAG: hypothetical protein ABI064_07080, partial [Acidobacteriaceae bacterium]